jgi:hypothetical protein
MASPDPCDYPTARQKGKRCELLGNPDRVPDREHYSGTNHQAIGDGADSRKHGEGLEEGDIAADLVGVRAPKEVIASPHRVETKLLDQPCPIPNPARRRLLAEVGEKNAERHRRALAAQRMIYEFTSHVALRSNLLSIVYKAFFR